MIFFDPMYMLLVVLPGFLISGIASFLVRSAFKRYSRVGTMRGYTGAQAAQTLLDRAGITTTPKTRRWHYLNKFTRAIRLPPSAWQPTRQDTLSSTPPITLLFGSGLPWYPRSALVRAWG